MAHTVAQLMQSQLLTDSQVRCKITAATKKWLKDNHYTNKIAFRYIRGTYHFDNCANYMLSAKYILEQATGLSFSEMNASMARLIKSNTIH